MSKSIDTNAHIYRESSYFKSYPSVVYLVIGLLFSMGLGIGLGLGFGLAAGSIASGTAILAIILSYLIFYAKPNHQNILPSELSSLTSSIRALPQDAVVPETISTAAISSEETIETPSLSSVITPPATSHVAPEETPMQIASKSLIGQPVDIQVVINSEVVDWTWDGKNILGVRFIVTDPDSLSILSSLRNEEAIDKIPEKESYTSEERKFILTLLSATQSTHLFQEDHPDAADSVRRKALLILDSLAPNNDKEFIIRLSRLAGPTPLDFIRLLTKSGLTPHFIKLFRRHREVFTQEFEGFLALLDKSRAESYRKNSLKILVSES